MKAEAHGIAGLGMLQVGWMRTWLMQMADWAVEAVVSEERRVETDVNADAEGKCAAILAPFHALLSHIFLSFQICCILVRVGS